MRKSNTSSKKLFLVLIIILITLSSSAQKSKKTEDIPKVPIAKTKSSLKAFEEIINSNALVDSGMFNVYQQDDKYFLEIPDSLLGRDLLSVTRISKASADLRNKQSMLGYGGDQVNQKVIRFEKGPQNKIFLRYISFSETSKDSTMAMYRAVSNSNMESIAATFDIKASSKNYKGSLIEVSDFIGNDNEVLFFEPLIKQLLKIGPFQPDKSYNVGIKSYPVNIEVRAVKTYLRTAQFPHLPATGFASLELNTSIMLLPQKKMPIRYADDRVGYFTTSTVDYDRDPQGVKKLRMVTRWKLEPKEEDVEKYKGGELVEPKKPIVYYIDPATPSKWVPYLIQGINDWQIAFEKAGFKNAIIGKVAPTKEQDPTWSLEDARYSALVYKASDVPNAHGPNVHDPRSGEILESHINWYHNIMHLLRNWYLIQCSNVDPKARKMEIDEELMGQLIRFVSSHEVGHTLGLTHNFGSSSTVSVEKLRDKAWVEAHGHTPSIMDYARFNYVAQPEDSISQIGLFPRIGDYDKWAIEWGYKIIPEAHSPEDEVPVLNKLTIERLKNKELWYGSPNSSNDPRSQTEDLGDDAMIASLYGIKNLKTILPRLPEWTKIPNENYGNLSEIYGELVAQYGRYIGHVTQNIGGTYETPKTVEQNGSVYQNVSKNTQRRAIAFLNQQLFITPKWLFNSEIMDKVGVNPVQLVSDQQNGVVDKLLSKYMLAKLISAEAKDGAKAYTAADLLSDLRAGIWSELSNSQIIDVYRRNLQKQYISNLEILTTSPVPGPFRDLDPTRSDITSIARAELVQLRSKIKTALPLIKDDMTKYHLIDLSERIRKILEGSTT